MNFDPHIELTVLATLLYVMVNYMCTNPKMSSDIMKMLSLKSKNNLKMICIALFALAFYFISENIVDNKKSNVNQLLEGLKTK